VDRPSLSELVQRGWRHEDPSDYNRAQEDVGMPLRDHFRPPLEDLRHWEGFLAQWPGMIVQALSSQLPQHYVATPRIISGSFVPMDATHLPAQDEYKVRVYDSRRGRRLVATVEIVSPANKGRPEHRRAFVGKCAALLQERVSVTVVDLVTSRNFNLYRDLLDLAGLSDPSLGPEPPSLYAVACRGTKRENDWLLETWAHALALGRPLPTLPLWLADDLAVPLELEASYEETCRVLRIP
jgi:hypothetical protein